MALVLWLAAGYWASYGSIVTENSPARIGCTAARVTFNLQSRELRGPGSDHRSRCTRRLVSAGGSPLDRAGYASGWSFHKTPMQSQDDYSYHIILYMSRPTHYYIHFQPDIAKGER